MIASCNHAGLLWNQRRHCAFWDRLLEVPWPWDRTHLRSRIVWGMEWKPSGSSHWPFIRGGDFSRVVCNSANGDRLLGHSTTAAWCISMNTLSSPLIGGLRVYNHGADVAMAPVVRWGSLSCIVGWLVHVLSFFGKGQFFLAEHLRIAFPRPGAWNKRCQALAGWQYTAVQMTVHMIWPYTASWTGALVWHRMMTCIIQGAAGTADANAPLPARMLYRGMEGWRDEATMTWSAEVCSWHLNQRLFWTQASRTRSQGLVFAHAQKTQNQRNQCCAWWTMQYFPIMDWQTLRFLTGPTRIATYRRLSLLRFDLYWKNERYERVVSNTCNPIAIHGSKYAC